MSDVAGQSKIEFHVDGEWTAVYLDGELVRVGDHYLADEWLQERAGVKVVCDNAFMRGQMAREGVARTLAEVAEYRERRALRRRQVLDLRAQAKVLLMEAERLEGPDE
jgi:hypothetical protein